MQSSQSEKSHSASKAPSKEESFKWLEKNLAPFLKDSNLLEKESLLAELNVILVERRTQRLPAVKALSKLLVSELLAPTDIFYFIKTILLTTRSTPEEEETALKTLAVLPSFCPSYRENLESTVSFREAGKLTLEFLEKKIRSHEIDTTDDIMPRVCELVSYFGFLEALPNLEAIKENGRTEIVKEAAHRAIANLKNTVSYIYRDTKPDLVSTSEFRAREIETALKDPNLLQQEQIQVLFNSTRQFEIEIESDPLYATLTNTFDHEDERVRLALCLAVSEMKLNSQLKPLKDRLIDVLADLGVNARSPAIALEACVILESLENKLEDSKSTIAIARHNANLAYLKRFGL